MWKKLALLATVASVVTQVVRYWNQAGPKTAAQRKRQARQDVNRWEDEGGNLRPDTAKPHRRAHATLRLWRRTELNRAPKRGWPPMSTGAPS